MTLAGALEVVASGASGPYQVNGPVATSNVSLIGTGKLLAVGRIVTDTTSDAEYAVRPNDSAEGSDSGSCSVRTSVSSNQTNHFTGRDTIGRASSTAGATNPLFIRAEIADSGDLDHPFHGLSISRREGGSASADGSLNTLAGMENDTNPITNATVAGRGGALLGVGTYIYFYRIAVTF